MDNVIVGPWVRMAADKIQDDEEKLHEATQALVKELADSVFDGMREAGFDNCGDMCYSKDLALIAESIRSYLLHLQEKCHPMQDVAEAMYVVKRDGTITAQPIKVTRVN